MITACYRTLQANGSIFPRVVLQKSSYVGVSQFVNNFPSFLQTLLNSSFLSSETKSLSLTLTVEKIERHTSLKAGWRMTPALLNFSLIHRCDGTHV